MGLSWESVSSVFLRADMPSRQKSPCDRQQLDGFDLSSRRNMGAETEVNECADGVTGKLRVSLFLNQLAFQVSTLVSKPFQTFALLVDGAAERQILLDELQHLLLD